MADKLARIHWQMGQALLPEHLFAQEESLLAEMRMRFQLLSFPVYGIGRLQWNESLLKEGVLSLLSLTLVLPSGQLIDIPGNATGKSFNMNVAGSAQLSVYLHVIDESTGRDQTSYIREEETVEKIIYEVELSSDQSHAAARYTMKLAEFRKDGEGVWSLSDNYVPPLIQTATSPFLNSTLNYIFQLLEAFHFKLTQEIAAGYLSGENLFTAKQCLQAVYALQHFFCNLKGQVRYHPYYLYEALNSFYLALCLYQNCTPENVESPYLHEQLADCFRKITDPLVRQMQMMKAQTPYLPFKKSEGLFTIAKLPKEIVDAKEVYFLIQKPKVTTPISIEGLKLASMSRVGMVHQMSLQGIPFKRIPNPPFQHTFGVEVDFFLIMRGEEWDYALGERTLAFYEKSTMEGIAAYIYWRQG